MENRFEKERWRQKLLVKNWKKLNTKVLFKRTVAGKISNNYYKQLTEENMYIVHTKLTLFALKHLMVQRNAIVLKLVVNLAWTYLIQDRMFCISRGRKFISSYFKYNGIFYVPLKKNFVLARHT